MRTLLLLALAAFAAATTPPPPPPCHMTATQPRKARYLKFCQDYNSRACCIPGHDLENQVQFENLIDGLGPGCKNPMMYPELRYFYCLGCDPDQPRYTDLLINGPSGNPRIRICQSFIDRLWSDPAYEDCGVMYPNPCPSAWGDDGMDPYTCGDDLLLPKSAASWETIGIEGRFVSAPPNGTLFLNTFKPPGLEDFDFVADPGSWPNDCWDAKAFRTSGSARLSSVTGMAIMLMGMLIPLAYQRL